MFLKVIGVLLVLLTTAGADPKKDKACAADHEHCQIDISLVQLKRVIGKKAVLKESLDQPAFDREKLGFGGNSGGGGPGGGNGGAHMDSNDSGGKGGKNDLTAATQEYANLVWKTAKPAFETNFTQICKSAGGDDQKLQDLVDAQWSLDTHASGGGTNEWQMYRPENVACDEQGFFIKVTKDEACGKDHVCSAKLRTRQRFHGNMRVEFQVRLPQRKVRGTWAAAWLLGPEGEKGWPRCGEIDVMVHAEITPDLVHQTIQTGAYSLLYGNPKANSTSFSEAGLPAYSGPKADFVTYGVAVLKDKLIFTVNHQARFVYSKSEDEASKARAQKAVDSVRDSYGEPRYNIADEDLFPWNTLGYESNLILNMAFGGTWGGNGVNKNAAIQQLVDHAKSDDPNSDVLKYHVASVKVWYLGGELGE